MSYYLRKPYLKSLFPGILFIAALVSISGCDWMDASKKSFESVAVEDVIAKSNLSQPVEYAYVAEGDALQKLDFYRYEGEGEVKRPVLVWIHGGEWVSGDKRMIDPIAFQIAGLGKYDLISINYRLADDESAPWPEIVNDVNSAIRWTKLNSETLGIDPDRIVLAGESAGAHLAAMAAFGSDSDELQGEDNPGPDTKVRAAVLFFGPYNMSSLVVQNNSSIKSGMCKDPESSSPVLELLDCPEPDAETYKIDSCDLKKVRTADPCAYVDKSDPPAYIAHGQHDCVVPWGQSKALHDELDDAGVRNVFVSVENGEHSISTLQIEPQNIVAFIQASFVNEKESVTDVWKPKPPTKQ